MMPVLQIGPVALPLPSLLLIAGLWLGLELTERFASRHASTTGRPDASQVYNLIMLMLAAGLIGARLTYVLRYPSEFAASPTSLFSLDPGLLDPAGGLAGALIAGLVYGQRKKLAFWPTLDAVTPLLAVLAVALALSHLASGAAFGAPTSLPWGLELWGARRHPSQLYELAAAVLILILIWPGREVWKTAPAGQQFLLFMALSAGARLLLETFRGDSVFLPLSLPWGHPRLAQAAAWLVLALSLWGLHRLPAAADTPVSPPGATSDPAVHVKQ